MKAQVIVSPLPLKSKMKASKTENYNQLLLANNNNEPETKWWNHFLSPLETKYQLYYHLGKTVFQIYYLQGKNKAVNKEINQNISHTIKDINEKWQQILQVVKGFEVYRDNKLKPAIEELNKELMPIVKEQRSVAPESDEYKALASKQETLIEGYKEHPLVKEANDEYRKYQDQIKQQLDDYLAKTGDFNQLLKDMEFIAPANPEKEVQ